MHLVHRLLSGTALLLLALTILYTSRSSGTVSGRGDAGYIGLKSDLISGLLPSSWTGSSENDSEIPLLLLATPTPPSSFARRQLIRQRWHSLYASPNATFAFVIGDVDSSDPATRKQLEDEEWEYGDIIRIPDLPETHQIANSIKPIRFYSLLTSMASGRTGRGHGNRQPRFRGRWRHRFVAKVDDDAFICLPLFLDRFLLPQLQIEDEERGSSGISTAKPLTWIATDVRDLYDPGFWFPGGSFYTMSFDLVQILADQWNREPIEDLAEDVLLGQLAVDAGIANDLNIITLTPRDIFDYEAGWRTTDRRGHEVCSSTMGVHKLKTDELYTSISGMFDEHGLMEGVATC